MKRLSSLCAVLFCLLGGPGTGQGADRPNILWITAEDMSPNLGCYGDAFARTPNLDALAGQGIRYRRAFATAPVCSPARACLITGIYATTLGNPHLRCEVPLPEGVRAPSAYLREAGYFCVNNVKTDYNLENEEQFIKASWDRCSGTAHWRQRGEGQPFFAIFNLMETHQSRTSVWPYEEFKTLAQRWLEPGERADPAQVPLPPYYPDTPLARRAMARYYDCIQIMDKRVGRILGELEADGLADDTIVFFYSDHGMGMPRGKRLLHDSGMHVPLIVRFPKRYQHLAPAEPGSAPGRLVSFVDVPPSLLGLVGLEVPGHMQGIPFLGPKAGSPREYVYGARDRVDEVFETSRSVRDERWLYIRNFRPHQSWMPPESYSDQSSFRRQLARLAEAGELDEAAMTYARPRKPVEELYDTLRDPHQIRNLAGSLWHRARLQKMRRTLAEWVVESRDLGLIPEQQLQEMMGEKVPYAWAQQKDDYPIASILAAARKVGKGHLRRDLLRLVHDEHPTIRYWGVIGLRAQLPEAEVPSHWLERRLDDASASVRIEAAGALLEQAETGHDKATTVLIEALNGVQLHAALHAARTLQLLGEKARPALPAMQARRKSLDALENADLAMFLRFALDAALHDLAGGEVSGPE